MLKRFLNLLKEIDCLRTPSFWIDSFLLFLSIPFFLFPSRVPLVTILVLCGWLIRWLWELGTAPAILNSPFALLITLFALWSIVPILVSTEPDLTLDKAMGLLLGFIAWRFIVTYIQDRITINLYLVFVLILGIGFVGIGFLAVDWLEKIPAISAIISIFPQQLISFSAIGSGRGVQPNQLAGTILWLFPFSAGIAFWSKELKSNGLTYLLWLITFIFLGILFLSQSRGGWLGGLAAIGFAVWIAAFTVAHGHPFRIMCWLLPALVALTAGGVLVVFGPQTLIGLWIDPPDSTLIGNLGTLSFRQEVWMWAIQVIQDFAFTGTGLGTFRQVVHRLYPINIPITYDIAHAHNVFLQVALDVGLVGLVLYLGLIMIFFTQGIKTLLHSPEYRWIIIGLLAGQVGFHFYGLVDTIALGAKPALLFWLLLGLIDRLITQD